MVDKEKDLNSDFWKPAILEETKIIVENVNNQVWNTLSSEKELSISVIEEIQELNQDIEILYENWVLFCDNPESIKLPGWFYYSYINNIITNYIKEPWISVNIKVYPLRYHPKSN